MEIPSSKKNTSYAFGFGGAMSTVQTKKPFAFAIAKTYSLYNRLILTAT